MTKLITASSIVISNSTASNRKAITTGTSLIKSIINSNNKNYIMDGFLNT